MEKLKRERGSPWLRENEKISQRVEVGAGRPTCGGSMWRCGAVREEEAAELKKRKEKIERKGWRRGRLNWRKEKGRIKEGRGISIFISCFRVLN